MTAAWRTAVSRPNPDGVSSRRSRTSSNRGRDKSCHRCVRAGKSNSRLVRARSARASSRLAPRGARQPRLRRTPIRLTGGVVERLCGQRLRLPDARSFRFGGIETACRSHQQIKATPVCPRAFVAVGGRARLGRCRAESVPRPAGQSRTRRGDVAAPELDLIRPVQPRRNEPRGATEMGPAARLDGRIRSCPARARRPAARGRLSR